MFGRIAPLLISHFAKIHSSLAQISKKPKFGWKMLRGRISIVLLLLFAAFNSIFGLLKLQTEIDAHGRASNLLVDPSLAKDDTVYLFQFPRTSTTPSQAALNLFIETVIKFMGIKFRRISNQFFLGSHSAGAAPFIQYQGKYIDGTNNILEKLCEIHQKMYQNREEGTSEIQGLLEHPRLEEETKIRHFAENYLYKILMKDRTHRTPHGTGGLNFMLNDAGLAEQMLPVMPKLLHENPTGLILFLGENWTIVEIGKVEFWAEFFKLSKMKEKERKIDPKFLELVHNLKIEDLPKFMSKMEQLVKDELERQITDLTNHNSFESKLHSYLKQHKFKLDGATELTYEEAREDQIYGFFESKLKELRLDEKLKENKFLFGEKPSVADASLFGILVQFFETPLNMPKFRKIFYLGKNNRKHNTSELIPLIQRLHKFVENVKESLHLPGDKKWKALTKSPWQLNYEDDERELGDKYDGPYNIETGELTDFQNLQAFNQREFADSKVVKSEIAQMESVHADLLLAILDVVFGHVDGGTTVDKRHALVETAAYLCNLGKQKSVEEGKSCRETHKRKGRRMPEAKEKSQNQVIRKLVYQTILNFGDQLVAQNVRQATMDVYGKVAGFIEANDLESAKALTSVDAVGDEQ